MCLCVCVLSGWVGEDVYVCVCMCVFVCRDFNSEYPHKTILLGALSVTQRAKPPSAMLIAHIIVLA